MFKYQGTNKRIYKTLSKDWGAEMWRSKEAPISGKNQLQKYIGLNRFL